MPTARCILMRWRPLPTVEILKVACHSGSLFNVVATYYTCLLGSWSETSEANHGLPPAADAAM